MPQWLGVDGVHFHSLREQNPATRERTMYIIKQALEPQLHSLSRMNSGGGHHTTIPPNQRMTSIDESISSNTATLNST
ncbi:MAG: hypothetical protein LR011_00855 [Verrucomicrobia bacterium]|nr:hypothetical protein [Verrucomicrobiota bacterium]